MLTKPTIILCRLTLIPPGGDLHGLGRCTQQPAQRAHRAAADYSTGMSFLGLRLGVSNNIYIRNSWCAWHELEPIPRPLSKQETPSKWPRALSKRFTSMKGSIATVLKTWAEADEVCSARIRRIRPTEIIAKHSQAYPRHAPRGC